MDVRLPRLGEGADSGAVVSIPVKEGDRIKKNQTLIELENEKAVAPIPSPAAGTVTKIHVKVGDKISVGQLIATLAEEGAAASAAPVRRETPSAAPEPVSRGQVKSALGAAASPSLRKTARDLGIDLDQVRGSGPGGRVLIEDLRSYVQRPSGSAADKPAAERIDFAKWGPVQRTPMSPLHRTVAQRMTESWTTIPHVYQFEEVDVTDLQELRKKHELAYAKKGATLTMTVLLLKITAGVLQKHPKFNSSLDEQAQEIVTKEYIHIGVAVDTEAGLIVPVIRDVDKKSILQIAKELKELAEKAKTRKISVEELHGGSFSISNQGGIGGAHFTPIIKKPESAILGIGRGKLKPVARAGKVEIRTIVPICLSYDHRVADGADAARCIRALVEAIEQFDGRQIELEK